MLNVSLFDGRGLRCFLLFVCVLSMIASGKPAVAEENNEGPAEATSVESKMRHPHCGLYCI